VSRVHQIVDFMREKSTLKLTYESIYKFQKFSEVTPLTSVKQGRGGREQEGDDKRGEGKERMGEKEGRER
jgi:hypothetical protein